MKGTSPLAGQRIVVTRARSQAGKLAARLEQEGAEVIEFETIGFRYSGDIKPQSAGSGYDWVVLTSANGVRGLARMVANNDQVLTDLRPAKFFAVGPATAEALADLGVEADLIPGNFIAEGGVEALGGAVPSWQGLRVLYACAKGARRVLPDALREWGAEVESRVVYETIVATPDPARIAALMTSDPQWLTFTSGSTARGFAGILGAAKVATLTESAAVASIGPQTSGACAESGLPVTVEAERHDIEGLVQAIVAFSGNEGV